MLVKVKCYQTRSTRFMYANIYAGFDVTKSGDARVGLIGIYILKYKMISQILSLLKVSPLSENPHYCRS